MDRYEKEALEQALVRGFFGDRRDGFFVEVGANQPREGSQTWHLEECGWKGILVEPLPDHCEALRAERPNSRVFQVACSAPGSPPAATFHVASDDRHSSLQKERAAPTATYERALEVPVRTLDDILKECGEPRIDFASIDVEGTELDVLRGFDLKRHRPALLLLEDHVYDLAKHRYLKAQGYRLIRRTSLNNWYVPASAPVSPSPWERLRLFRKMYLGLPTRKLRRRRQRRRQQQQQA